MNTMMHCMAWAFLISLVSTQALGQSTVYSDPNSSPSPMSQTTIDPVKNEEQQIFNTEITDKAFGTTNPSPMTVTTLGTSTVPEGGVGTPPANRQAAPATDSSRILTSPETSIPSAPAGVLVSQSDIVIGGNIKLAKIGGTTLPPSAEVLAQGEVINADADTGRIMLRNAIGQIISYPVTDQGVLANLQDGDQVQIYR